MMDVDVLIPRQVGEKSQFSTVDGRKWLLRKKSGDSYILTPAGVISPGASRWGDKDQICNDLRYLARYGSLPPASDQRW